jgi:outer membrane protein OmpA-like peptidoglycan-associated protein
MKINTILKVAAIAVSASLLIGCATKTKEGNNAPAVPGAQNAGPQGLAPSADLQATLNALPNTVYFGFDQYNLTPKAIAALQQNAAVLLKNPQVNIMIAGNADPRGSVEYNFHLGMRRAQATYNYLVQQGVPAAQMCMVSYGDMKPVATPEQFGGNKDKAYSMNRNAQIGYNENCTGWDANQYKGGH